MDVCLDAKTTAVPAPSKHSIQAQSIHSQFVNTMKSVCFPRKNTQRLFGTAPDITYHGKDINN